MAARSTNRVRIIAGDWRSRQITFPESIGLRPTPDRVRETLFNWLQFELAGRRVLDLYAGSGALGLEAASRGAARVTLVEQQAAVADALRDNIERLDANNVELVQQDALTVLDAGGNADIDIVFLDPPYQADLLASSCDLLERRQWLSNHARIYLEHERGGSNLDSYVPASWQCIKTGKAGQVEFGLYARNPT